MRPSLSLASCQLIATRDHRWGFPCCVWSPLPTCHRHYPGRFDEACSLVLPHRQRPSLCNSQVGSCDYCFGACSAFTHVTPARSPSRRATLYTESSDSFVASTAVSIATGWSEPVPGREFHPLKSSAFHGALFHQLRILQSKSVEKRASR